MFGEGVQGVRPPTGLENIRAVYRTGLGQTGNVKARQVTQLIQRPLGVNDVVNPLPATGGADPEPPAQMRRNVPTGLLALDRLVSLADYADFARRYAGIARAHASRFPGLVPRVHVTVAGLDDIPLTLDSQLLQSLTRSLRRFGDPAQPIEVAPRRLRLIVVEAEVAIDPDYLWDRVSQSITASMLDLLGFNHRELGQDVRPSSILAAIQQVPGVVSARLNAVDTVPEVADEVFAQRWKTAEELLMREPDFLSDDDKTLLTSLQANRLAIGQEVTPNLIAIHFRVVAKLSEARELDLDKPITVPLADWEVIPDPANPKRAVRRIAPASLAYLSPKVPASLVLKEARSRP
jgi:hypothetical protein